MACFPCNCSTAAKQYLRVFDAAGQLHRQSHAALFVTMDFFNSAGGRGRGAGGASRCVTPVGRARYEQAWLDDTLIDSCADPAVWHAAAGPAGAKVSLLPQLRMAALCRPLHPDIVSIVREGLDHVGLLSPTLREAAVGAKRLP